MAVTPDPDHALLAAVAHGDRTAARQLVERKLPRLIGLAVRLLRDQAEAEDIAQETFVRVWKMAPQWKPGPTKFDTWMHTVALNLCRDRLRRSRRTELGEVPEQIDPAPAADSKIETDQRALAVRAALHRLPDRQREALVLQHYIELSNIEAAQVMGISVEALESLLARGRRHMRDLLGDI